MGQDLNIFKIIWESGFVVKMVLLLLFLSSVASWAIVVRKLKTLKLIEFSNQKFMDFFRHSTSLQEIARCADENDGSSLGMMYKFGHNELQKIKEQLDQEKDSKSVSEYLALHGSQALERSLKQAATQANDKMEDLLSVLASISSVTPFVGLFGTVWGIINSFTGLSQGGGSIEAVAPGIAEALVATAVGLAAAIPASWFYNYFSSRIARINGHMESFGQEFMNLVERSLFINKR